MTPLMSGFEMQNASVIAPSDPVELRRMNFQVTLNQKKLNINKTKNLTHKRHWISWCVRIVKPIPKLTYQGRTKYVLCVMYHISRVRCHKSAFMCKVSHDRCQMSCVTCYMFHVACHLSPVTNANSNIDRPFNCTTNSPVLHNWLVCRFNINNHFKWK